MSVTADGETIVLSGDCGIDDVEVLLALLQGKAGRPIDLSGATHLHGAILQVLLVFRPPRSAEAADPFVKRWLTPVLDDPRFVEQQRWKPTTETGTP